MEHACGGRCDQYGKAETDLLLPVLLVNAMMP
jgi:hypothetical protein